MEIKKSWTGEEFWYPDNARDRELLEEGYHDGKFNRVVSGLGQGGYRRK